MTTIISCKCNEPIRKQRKYMHGIVKGEQNKLSQIGLDFTSDWLKLWHDLIFRAIHSRSAVIFHRNDEELGKASLINSSSRRVKEKYIPSTRNNASPAVFLFFFNCTLRKNRKITFKICNQAPNRSTKIDFIFLPSDDEFNYKRSHDF